MSGIVLRPVGFVRNEMRKAVPRGEYENVVSDVIVEEEFSAGLDDIEEHSHAVIIFWLDRISEDERKLLKVRPKGDPSLPIVGVFATRSPARPEQGRGPAQSEGTGRAGRFSSARHKALHEAS
jgi:tRNA (Thr-GGU) A37 N-methylase